MTSFTPDLVERLLANNILIARGIQSGGYFNPDGPEAAKVIAELTEALREARQFVVIHGPAAAFPDLIAKMDAVLDCDRSEPSCEKCGAGKYDTVAICDGICVSCAKIGGNHG